MTKSRLFKGRSTKIKYKMTKHAQRRLKERFNLDHIGKIYENQIEPLTSFTSNLKVFLFKPKDMVIIRNKKSRNIVTVLTPDIWNSMEFKETWEEYL